MTKSKVTMYRGVRLGGRYQDVDDLKNYGMKYYWNNAHDAIADIYRLLYHFKKISKLGRVPLLRDYILEAGREYRIQMFATVEKENAMSYAANTPELIGEVAYAAGLDLKQKIRYLNNFYGKPYVVKFKVELEIGASINTPIGKFIPNYDILEIEPVDITKPDPWIKRLNDSVKKAMVMQQQ